MKSLAVSFFAKGRITTTEAKAKGTSAVCGTIDRFRKTSDNSKSPHNRGARVALGSAKSRSIGGENEGAFRRLYADY